jgi:hypothetical protein
MSYYIKLHFYHVSNEHDYPLSDPGKLNMLAANIYFTNFLPGAILNVDLQYSHELKPLV